MGRYLPVVIAAVFSPASFAFEIDAPPVMAGQPVHESITREAVVGISANLGVSVSATARDAIVAGAQNPDTQIDPHKIGVDLNDYHINNAHMANGQLQRSMRLIRDLVNQAIALSRDNPRALNPAGVNLAGFGLALTAGCNRAPGPCAVLGGVAQAAGVLSIPHSADPHTAGAPLDLLRRTLPAIARDASPALRAELADLQRELDGYVARQLTGHAFHALQDVFAHSNFVELVNGRSGPPCGRSQPASSSICDSAVDGEPTRFGDAHVGRFLIGLGRDFDLRLATFTNALGAQAQSLQTGFVSLAAGPVNMCPDVRQLPDGFDYCHWSSPRHPALNKDGTGPEEASHANHRYARQLALFASEILWEHYLRASELAAPVRLTPSDLTVGESSSRFGPRAAALVFTVPRPFTTRTPFKVRFASSGEARAGSSCATGVDFVTTAISGTFERGATTARVPLTVCPDNLVEGNERLIASVGGDHVAGARYFVTIVDDDRYPVPVLDRVGPIGTSSALASPGTRIALSGRDFQRTSYAELDGRRLAVEFKGAGALHATLPKATTTGSHSVRVITPSGGASRTVAFRVGPIAAATKSRLLKQ